MSGDLAAAVGGAVSLRSSAGPASRTRLMAAPPNTDAVNEWLNGVGNVSTLNGIDLGKTAMTGKNGALDKTVAVIAM